MRTPSLQTVDIPLAGQVAALLLVLTLPLALPGASPSGGVDAPRASPASSSSGLELGLRALSAAAAPPRAPAPPAAMAASSPSDIAGGPARPGSDGLVATILELPPTVDAGVTVTLAGQALGGFPPYEPVWSLQTGNLTTGWSIRWTSPNTPRTVNVLFEVKDHSGWVSVATGAIRVVPSPFLELSGPPALGDVGLPFLFSVNLTGGVGPFVLRWTLVNGSSNGSSTVPSDGTYAAAVVPVGPGPMWVLGSVLDSWNRSFAATAPLGRATPPPALTPATVPFAEVGYRTPISVGVADGTPPFVWSVAATSGVSSVIPSDGTLASDGALQLSATFDRSGNYSLPLRVEDAAGALVETNVTLSVAGGLNLSVALATPTATAGTSVGLTATIAGGLPPYSYRFAFSDNEAASGNVSLPGPVHWQATPAAAGYLTLRASVTDSTGRSANVTLTLYVTPPSGAPIPGPPAASDSGSLAVVGTAAGAVLTLAGVLVVRRWWRWPKHTPRPDRPDEPGRSMVRELLAEADDGIDLATLELLAEERHLTSAEVAAAVASWQRAGRVRVDAADDGREVVRWVAAPTRGPAASNASPNSEPVEGAP